MDDFLDFCTMVVLPMVLILGVLGGGIVLAVNAFSRYQCNNYENVTGMATRYVSFDACYIQTAKGWQRWDEYKVRAVASEGLLP